jgi:hypothetical protein
VDTGFRRVSEGSSSDIALIISSGEEINYPRRVHGQKGTRRVDGQKGFGEFHNRALIVLRAAD